MQKKVQLDPWFEKQQAIVDKITRKMDDLNASLDTGLLGEGEFQELYAEARERKDSAERKLRDANLEAAADMALFNVYFKELGLVKYSREELYSLADFIGTGRNVFLNLTRKVVSFNKAAIGGIIGLCCGFSLLSGLEVVYWFTVRVATDAWRNRRGRRVLRPN